MMRLDIVRPGAAKLVSGDPVPVSDDVVAPPLAFVVSERAFQAAVVELAWVCGWRVYHTHDSRRSAAGFPDLVLVRPPRLLFAELKSARGRMRAEQREWLAALGAVPGVEAAVWRPGDWPEIERALM